MITFVVMSRWISADQFHAFEAGQTSAHRIYSTFDAWAERLGEDVLISHKVDSARDAARIGLQSWEAETGFRSRRVFARFLPKQNAERVSPQLLDGDASLPLETVVMENGVRYGIDFGAGYAAGLFIDQRANRAHVGRLPLKGKRMLNTFSYTCSFSVVAARAGAETLSLDLSKKSLERGKSNFSLNGLSLDGHRFLADDVLDVLPRLEKRGEKFDLIILDPPTFSLGNKGRRWKVEEQMEDLLGAALELAKPGASILLSTNCTKFDRPTLERTARFAVKLARMSASYHHEPLLPDFPPGHGAQTIWLVVR
jgi:23S rRNA (cytosine1962-C5)-methyltransferase